MFIASARISSREFLNETYALYTEVEEEDINNRKIQLSRPLAQEIMKAGSCNITPMSFVCNGTKYELQGYFCNKYEQVYNVYRIAPIGPKIAMPKGKVFVLQAYRDRCRCTSCYSSYRFDTIENLCAVVPLRKNPDKKVDIDIQRCTKCHKYFIDEQSLKIYEQKHGQLLIKVERNPFPNFPYDDEDNDQDFYYPENTILSRHGYSTKLDRYERLQRIDEILKSGGSKAEVKDCLTRFIQQRGMRCPSAKVKWQSDLEYVNEFNLSVERKIVINDPPDQ